MTDAVEGQRAGAQANAPRPRRDRQEEPSRPRSRGRALWAAALALFAVVAGLGPSAASGAVLAEVARQPATGGDTRGTAQYVALGDSYASGNGSGGPVTGGTCLRNAGAYPEVWASHHPAYVLDFQACSGASIGTVIGTQLRSLSSRTELITVTVGGDDNGYFDSIIATCILDGPLGLDSHCRSVIAQDELAVNHLLGGPTGRYERLYRAIGRIEGGFAKTAVGFHPARLVVLVYPDPFRGGSKCGPWDATTQQSLDSFANTLDTVMRQSLAAARLSIPTSFIDVRPAFADHGICAAVPWISGLRYDVNGFKDSYHPNKQGQQAYARLLTQVTG